MQICNPNGVHPMCKLMAMREGSWGPLRYRLSALSNSYTLVGTQQSVMPSYSWYINSLKLLIETVTHKLKDPTNLTGLRQNIFDFRTSAQFKGHQAYSYVFYYQLACHPPFVGSNYLRDSFPNVTCKSVSCQIHLSL